MDNLLRSYSRLPSRRAFLRASGVMLTLPLLDSLAPRSVHAALGDKVKRPQRMVCICTSLGLHAPNLFPEQAGANYLLSPYLKRIAKHRDDFTVLGGLSHPDQTGKDGHSSFQTWLTSVRHPGLVGFRNRISIDQLLAEQIGLETRFPSLQLSTGGGSQSYSRSGIMLQGETNPSKVFAKLFIEGSPQEKAAQIQRLREGQSILDSLRDEARQFAKRVGSDDRQTLDEYYQSVREMEQRLGISQEWVNKRKPEIVNDPPNDIDDQKDLIGRMELLLGLIPLIVQTDSTRLITVVVQGRGDVPPIPGVELDHHNLSHHGKDENKIRQLRLIEEAQFDAFGGLLDAMSRKTESGERLIDTTSILLGSNLGNANAHDTKNLPILLAGGNFRHGTYVQHRKTENVPLSNLFVQIAQQMGSEIDAFGSSTSSSVDGLQSKV